MVQSPNLIIAVLPSDVSQAWLIGRAAARTMVGREVYVGSRLGAWPDVVLRTEQLEHDLQRFLESVNVSAKHCSARNLLHLNPRAADAGIGSAVVVDRKRLEHALLKGKTRRRFCRTFAVDFLYLGYEGTWQRHCSRIFSRSLDLTIRGRLVYAVQGRRSITRQPLSTRQESEGNRRTAKRRVRQSRQRWHRPPVGNTTWLLHWRA